MIQQFSMKFDYVQYKKFFGDTNIQKKQSIKNSLQNNK